MPTPQLAQELSVSTPEQVAALIAALRVSARLALAEGDPAALVYEALAGALLRRELSGGASAPPEPAVDSLLVGSTVAACSTDGTAVNRVLAALLANTGPEQDGLWGAAARELACAAMWAMAEVAEGRAEMARLTDPPGDAA